MHGGLQPISIQQPAEASVRPERRHKLPLHGGGGRLTGAGGTPCEDAVGHDLGVTLVGTGRHGHIGMRRR